MEERQQHTHASRKNVTHGNDQHHAAREPATRKAATQTRQTQDQTHQQRLHWRTEIQKYTTQTTHWARQVVALLYRLLLQWALVVSISTAPLCRHGCVARGNSIGCVSIAMPRKRTRGEDQSSRSCGDDRCGGSSLGSVTQSASWRPTPCRTTDRPSSRPGRPGVEEVVREVHIYPMKRVWKKQAIPLERVQYRTMQSVHVVDVRDPSGVKRSVDIWIARRHRGCFADSQH